MEWASRPHKSGRKTSPFDKIVILGVVGWLIGFSVQMVSHAEGAPSKSTKDAEAHAVIFAETDEEEAQTKKSKDELAKLRAQYIRRYAWPKRQPVFDRDVFSVAKPSTKRPTAKSSPEGGLKGVANPAKPSSLHQESNDNSPSPNTPPPAIFAPPPEGAGQ